MKREIATAVLVLGLARPAAAGFYTHVETVEVDAGGIGVAAPSCEPHTRVGGGFDSNDPTLVALASTTEQDFPVWDSALLNYGDAAVSFKGAVVCSDSAPEPTIVEESFSVAGTVSGLALCPPGTVALSGGVGVIGDVADSATVLLSPIFPSDPAGDSLHERADGEAPAPGGWEAVEVVDKVTTVTASVFAVCLERANVATLVESNVAAPGAVGEESVFCPDGKTAVGGGVDALDRSGLRLLASGPIFFGVPVPKRLADVSGGLAGPPIGWRVAVRNTHKTEGRPFHAAAICVPEPGALVSGPAALLLLAAVRRRWSPSRIAR